MTFPPSDPYGQTNQPQQPGGPAPTGYPQQPGYAQPGYQQPAYQQPGYAQPGYQQAGLGQQPGVYPQAGAVDPASIPPDVAPADVGFSEAVKRYFKRFAQFKGAASRSEYWYAYLFYVLVAAVPGILYSIGLAMVVGSSAYDYDPYTQQYTQSGPSGVGLALTLFAGGLLGIWSLVNIVPMLAIAVRRLHDAGKPGIYILVNFIPFIGGIWCLILLISPTNRAAWQREWFM